MSSQPEPSPRAEGAVGPSVFEAELEIIGINPFVSVPEPVLETVFAAAGVRKGPIAICGEINGAPYQQSLVRYAGAWRLYVNTTMLKDSPRRIGERVSVSVVYDPVGRAAPASAELDRALAANPAAKAVFDALPPSRRLEIVRYIAARKSPASTERNVARAIAFLTGKGRFGRDRP
jgi:bacteriocin resistance YdeI/OmpD-like protein/uncharacterized protein DUF1905